MQSGVETAETATPDRENDRFQSVDRGIAVITTARKVLGNASRKGSGIDCRERSEY